jgi:hypothetical protein
MSDIGCGGDDSESLPTFRPFSREELAIIDKRIRDRAASSKKRADRKARNIAVSFVSKLSVSWCLNFGFPDP